MAFASYGLSYITPYDLCFLRLQQAPDDKRGKQLCTTQVKGTTLDTDAGEKKPKKNIQGALKRPRVRENNAPH